MKQTDILSSNGTKRLQTQDNVKLQREFILELKMNNSPPNIRQMKRKKNSLYIYLVYIAYPAIMLLQSCGGQSTSSLDYSNNTQPEEAQVTFADINSQILVPHCISCHGDVTTEAALMKWITPGNPEASPFFTTVESGSMPKNQPPLDSQSVELIRTYITQMTSSTGGTTGGTTGDTPTPAPTGITYDEFRSTVLVPYRCVQCHNVGTEASLAKWIDTNNPPQSLLYRVIQDGSMPQGGPRAPVDIQNFTLQYVKDFSARN